MNVEMSLGNTVLSEFDDGIIQDSYSEDFDRNFAFRSPEEEEYRILREVDHKNITESTNSAKSDVVGKDNLKTVEQNSSSNLPGGISALKRASKIHRGCSTEELLANQRARIQTPPGCTNGFLRGSVCLFACENFFMTPKRHQKIGLSVCQDDGTWDPSIPTCIPVVGCAGPEFPYGVHFVNECNQSEASVCLVQCKPHLMLYGPSSVTCQENGQWTAIPHCGCLIPNLTKSLEIRSKCVPYVGETCTVRCTKGMVMEGSPIIRCMESGQWSRLPECRNFCPEPQLPSNMKISEDCDRKDGRSCKIFCLANDKIVSSSIITCLSTRNWTELPICSTSGVVTCPAVQNAELMVEKDCDTSVGSVCNVSCVSGVVTNSIDRITCLDTGEWSVFPICEEIIPTPSPASEEEEYRKICSDSMLPPALKFMPSSCKQSKDMDCSVGCLVKVFVPGSLERPHRIVSIKKISCVAPGKWDNVPDCEAAQYEYWDGRIKSSLCPEPVLPMGVMVRDNCSTIDGSTCTLYCEEPLVIDGPTEINCANKTWSQFPRCEPPGTASALRCPNITITSGLEILEPCETSLHSVCHIACTEGFLQGSGDVTCLENGQWSALPSCAINVTSGYTDLECTHQIPQNVVINGNCSYAEGTACQVACKEGFNAIGTSTVFCASGVWSEFPHCVPKPITTQIITTPHCTTELPRGMFFEGKCSMSHRETCKVMCEPGMVLEGSEYIICMFGAWEHLPLCVAIEISSENTLHCEDVNLPSGLVALEPCLPIIGHTCRVKCLDAKILQGPETIKCLHDAKWSAIPTCIKSMPSNCSYVLTVPKLEFADKCELRDGDICQVFCADGYILDGPVDIICTNGKWINIPNCLKRDELLDIHEACKDPVLSPYLINTEPCVAIPGASCLLHCEKNLSRDGPIVLTCLSDGSWTDAPKCIGTLPVEYKCPSELPKGLSFRDLCLGNNGESCEVLCEGNLLIQGSSVVTCMNGTWSSLPTCIKPLAVCGEPQLPPHLVVVQKCSYTEGSSCTLLCDEDMIMEGSPVIICLPDGRWSDFPSCRKAEVVHRRCPNEFPHAVTPADKCDPTEGKHCVVYCEDDLALEGSVMITCRNGSWQNLPKCVAPEYLGPNENGTCKAPSLSTGLFFYEKCKMKIGRACFVVCKHHDITDGPVAVTCLPNGEWTEIPVCVNKTSTSPEEIFCDYPDLPTDLVLRDSCQESRSGDRCEVGCSYNRTLIGQQYIRCRLSREWSPFPRCVTSKGCSRDLPGGIVCEEQCFANEGDQCLVHCENNANIRTVIKCRNGHWEDLPECQKCDVPKLNQGLNFIGNCKAEIGHNCSLECTTGLYLQGPNSMACLPNRMWSEMPVCLKRTEERLLCHDSFPKGVTVVDKCIPKHGSHCVVYCEDEMLLRGSEMVTCRNGTWINVPSCAKSEDLLETCEKPKLPGNVSFFERCEALKGMACFLACQNDLILDGPVAITCLTNGMWTEIPECVNQSTADLWNQTTCRYPEVPLNVKLLDECHDSRPYDRCEVACKNNLTLVGQRYIRCRLSGEWSDMPNCVSSYTCPQELPEGLMFADTCSSLNGVQCLISCKQNTKITSLSFCDRGEWRNLPLCTASRSCPLDFLLDVTVDDKCSGNNGQECLVHCREFPDVKSVIKCSDSHWENLPSCNPPQGCPQLLPESMEFLGHCNAKNGYHCSVYCKKYPEILSVAVCNGNKWEKLPICTSSPLGCSLPESLAFEGYCKALDGDFCPVHCKENPEVSSIAKCEKGQWDDLPTCPLRCSHADLPETLIFTQQCGAKGGDQCPVYCKENPEIKGVVFCNGSRWENVPHCFLPQRCSHVLPGGLMFVGYCSEQTGDSCSVTCKGNPSIIGKIVCNKGVWEDIPECFPPAGCPKQIPELGFMGDCEFKHGDLCRVYCKQNPGIHGLILCNNSIWEKKPECILSQGCSLNFFPYLLFRDQCSAQNGDRCIVYCVENPSIEGIITCNHTKWEHIPDCTPVRGCPLDLPEVLFEQCSGQDGHECVYHCKENNEIVGVAVCDKGIWKNLSRCFPPQGCPRHLPSELQFLGHCNATSEDLCTVYCKENPRIEAVIFCNGTSWSHFPECPPFGHCPLETPEVIFQKQCERKNGQFCFFYCKNNPSITGEAFCKEGKWLNLLECVPPKGCAKNFSDSITFSGDCLATSGSTCTVHCKENPEITSIVFCKGTEWENLPECNPLQKCSLDLKDVVFDSNCNGNSGEWCSFHCRHNSDLSGTVKCDQGIWENITKCVPSLGCPKEPPVGLVFKSYCSAKNHDTCLAYCKENPRIEGTLVCNSPRWEHVPECIPLQTCAYDLPEIEFDDRCRGESGHKCFYHCKNNAEIAGEVWCHDGKWENLPICVPPVGCPKEPPEGLAFLGSCEAKSGNECSVYCKKSPEVRGFIICNATRWEHVPDCTAQLYCPLELPDVIFDTKCSGESHYQCSFHCKENLGITGTAVCHDGKWEGLPRCVPKADCPAEPPHGLIFLQNCSAKNGVECAVYCKENPAIETYILCNQTKWVHIPLCIPEQSCPVVLPDVVTVGFCEGKSGKQCSFHCRENPHVTSVVTCYNGQWENLPNCTIPVDCSRELPEGLEFTEPCTEKNGDKCFVRCKVNPKIGSMALCNQTRWEHLPVCVPIQNCSTNLLGVEFENNCQPMNGRTCSFFCKINPDIAGEALCNDGKWENIPKCVPPLGCQQEPPKGLLFVDSCNAKDGEECKVKCKINPTIMSSILCNRTNWVHIPKCIPPRSCSLDQKDVVLQKCSGESGHRCAFYCKINADIAGEVLCNNGLWENLPKCIPPPSCPKEPPEGLLFTGQCNSRNGEECEVVCRVNPSIKALVKCNQTKWEHVPECIPLKDCSLDLQDIAFDSKCEGKSGKNCSFHCKINADMTGEATCKNGDWENLPKCIPPPSCPKEPPEGLIFTAQCHSKNGEECPVFCRVNPSVKAFLLCNQTKWEHVPECIPPRDCPLDLQDVTFDKKCEGKSGHNCSFHCKINDNMIGEAACKDGEWKNLPKCIPPPSCPKEPPEGLNFLAQCNSKNGEECPVACSVNPSVKAFLLCNQTKWEHVPECIPPRDCPLDLQDVTFDKKCEGKSGHNCSFHCKINDNMIGEAACKDGEWENLPKCIPPAGCSKEPPEGLAFTGKCDGRNGEECQVTCKVNSAIKALLLCNGTTWEHWPLCVPPKNCPVDLPDIVFDNKCEGKSGQACSFHCKINSDIVGESTCNDGKWENTPKCVPPPGCSRQPPKGLKFRSPCSGKNGERCFAECVINPTIQAYIICSETAWTNMPDCIPLQNCTMNLSDLVFDHFCRGKSGDKCSFHCKENTDITGTAVCNNGVWENLPKCVPPPGCSRDPPDGLVFVGHCNAKQGEKCAVMCKENFATESIIICNYTQWQHIPECIPPRGCPHDLPDIEFVGHCEGKSGQKCAVHCKENSAIAAEVICHSGVWQNLPKCIPLLTCPQDLSEGLEFVETCERTQGTKCKVRCKDIPEINAEITCNHKRWENLPECIKPRDCSHSLPDEFVFGEPCEAFPGDHCYVYCKSNPKMIGFPQCKNGEWMDLPKCGSPENCPQNLSGGLVFGEPCEGLNRDHCYVHCKDNPSIIGFIHCVDGKWNDLPECGPPKNCPEDLPGGLVFGEPCERLNRDHCYVHCKDNPSIIGFIHCVDGRWNDLPECGPPKNCPEDLPGGLVFGEPCERLNKDHCYVHCKDNPSIIGFIHCIDGKWNDLPECGSPKNCPEDLPGGLIFGEPCERLNKDHCYVHCKDNPSIIGFIHCVDGTWMDLPQCTVPEKCPQELSGGLAFGEPCEAFNRDHCYVQCKENPSINGFAYCVDGRWIDLPRCVSGSDCPRDLPGGLVFRDTCMLRNGDQCFVYCKDNPGLAGSIACRNGKWEHVFQCTPSQDCPLDLPAGLVFSYQCNARNGDYCNVHCRENPAITGMITCNGGQWHNLPQCPVSHGCPQDLPGGLVFGDRCAARNGDQCFVYCRDNTAITGFASCHGGQWVNLPQCTTLGGCSQHLPWGLAFRDRCFAREGEQCAVYCTENYGIVGTAVCRNGQWESLPHCMRQKDIEMQDCEDLPLPDNVEILNDCKKRFRRVCIMGCPNAMLLVGPSKVECLPSGKWTTLPRCETLPQRKTKPNAFRSQELDLHHEKNDVCYPGYEYYNGKCYVLTDEIKGFDALTACNSPLEPLVIPDKETYEFIVRLLHERGIICLWAGINDIKEEGVWVDSRGSPVVFLPWQASEPSPPGSEQARIQNCVVMLQWDSYLYHDMSCLNLTCNFICQIDAHEKAKPTV